MKTLQIFRDENVNCADLPGLRKLLIDAERHRRYTILRYGCLLPVLFNYKNESKQTQYTGTSDHHTAPDRSTAKHKGVKNGQNNY